MGVLLSTEERNAFMLSIALFSSFLACVASKHRDALEAFMDQNGAQAVDLLGRSMFVIDSKVVRDMVRMSILSTLDVHSIRYSGPPLEDTETALDFSPKPFLLSTNALLVQPSDSSWQARHRNKT